MLIKTKNDSYMERETRNLIKICEDKIKKLEEARKVAIREKVSTSVIDGKIKEQENLLSAYRQELKEMRSQNSCLVKTANGVYKITKICNENIVASYKSGNEKIEIKEYSGEYVIYYGVGVSPSRAGSFSSLSEAEKTLKKHRPNAVKVGNSVSKINNGWAFTRRGGQPAGYYDMVVNDEKGYKKYTGMIWQIDKDKWDDRWGWVVQGGIGEGKIEGKIDGKDNAKRKVEEVIKEAIRKRK